MFDRRTKHPVAHEDLCHSPNSIRSTDNRKALVLGRFENPGKRDLPREVPVTQEKPESDCGAQNNIDSLWTWSVNGAKIALSLTILTGTVAIIQGVLGYWRDKVLVWWKGVKEKWRKFTSNDSKRQSREEGKNGIQKAAKKTTMRRRDVNTY